MRDGDVSGTYRCGRAPDVRGSRHLTPAVDGAKVGIVGGGARCRGGSGGGGTRTVARGILYNRYVRDAGHSCVVASSGPRPVYVRTRVAMCARVLHFTHMLVFFT